MNFPLLLAMVSLSAFLATGAGADTRAYNDKKLVRTANARYAVSHVHDWSSPRLQGRYLGYDRPGLFFTAANDFSRITVTDRATGRRILDGPSPALTYLWLSPDSRYLLGLSDVMLLNPYQLVVWD